MALPLSLIRAVLLHTVLTEDLILFILALNGGLMTNDCTLRTIQMKPK